MFDAELLATGRELSLDECLANIREFMGAKFNQLKAVAVVENLPLEIPKPVSSRQVNSELIPLPGGISLELIKIPAGNFLMGSNEDDFEKPPHQVSLPEFYLGKTPVTQAQWQAVMGNNPSRFSSNPKNPVENVSWNDCQTFCQKLSDLTGKICRLPSEAEWEYACRAGTESRYSFGDDEQLLKNYAWFNLNSGQKTQPVGLKQPNIWGLYDMYGNVWEWCADDWHKSYAKKPQNLKDDGSIIWLSGDSFTKLLRGGSWSGGPRHCRSAYRGSYYPDLRGLNIGFRVLCESPRLS